MFRISSRIAALVSALIVLAGPEYLGANSQADAATARGVAAVNGLSLRSAPKAGAPVIRRLPILTEIIILNRAKKPATIGGRKDSWVYVQANYCPDSGDTSPLCETVYRKGWVADSYIAYGNRFKPLSEWRNGRIEAKNGNTSWSYDIAANGRYTLDWESWKYDTKTFPCPSDRKRGRYCVESRSETGQLYRYRDVIRAGSEGDLLYVDAGGALCDRMSGSDGRMCDR